MARKRALNRLPDGRQRLLELGLGPSEDPAASPQPPAEQTDRFVPEQVVWLGNQALPDYLKERGLKLPLILKDLVTELDYSKLAKCKETGRKPIHPRVFVGLIVYGILKEQTSLRGLEELARADLGAMHICGGLQPDHSTIGRFVTENQEELSSNFFVEVTKNLAKKLPRSGKAAIDGTIVQAAASSYRTLRLEALREHAAQLSEKVTKDPANKALRKASERAQQAVQAAQVRTAKRKQKGKDASKVSVSPTEPEAVVQLQKGGRGAAPSYKPSIIVNDQGLVCGQAIHPTSETDVVHDLLDQHEKVTGSAPETLLADAGYSTEKVYQEALKRDIDLLVPAGKETAEGMKPTSRSGNFVKQDFVYDPATDTYRCPAGKSLFRMDTGKDGTAKEYTRYRARTSDCRNCPLKERCTDSSSRRIKRYPIDEQKEAMARILKHPLARATYAQRKVIVETPWAVLKEKQRLPRFRRFGLKGAGVELALHLLAYNLGLVARRALEAALALLFALWAASSRRFAPATAS